MTLCTLEQNRNTHSTAVTGFVYLLISLFCVLFGAVYEHFSHEVYSYYMIYAFLFPLLGGTAVFYGLSLFGKRMPGRIACNLYHSGIATLTIGSLFCGVLEIYGTTNALTSVYWIVGWLFVLAGVIFYFLSDLKKSK